MLTFDLDYFAELAGSTIGCPECSGDIEIPSVGGKIAKKTPKEPVDIFCPSCGSDLGIDKTMYDKLVGVPVACPKCGRVVVVGGAGRKPLTRKKPAPEPTYASPSQVVAAAYTRRIAERERPQRGRQESSEIGCAVVVILLVIAVGWFAVSYFGGVHSSRSRWWSEPDAGVGRQAQAAPQTSLAPERPGMEHPPAVTQELERDVKHMAVGLLIVSICALILALFLYIVPSIIAFKRGHQNAVAILALNLLLGWTFLGWVAALVWSLTETRRS